MEKSLNWKISFTKNFNGLFELWANGLAWLDETLICDMAHDSGPQSWYVNPRKSLKNINQNWSKNSNGQFCLRANLAGKVSFGKFLLARSPVQSSEKDNSVARMFATLNHLHQKSDSATTIMRVGGRVKHTGTLKAWFQKYKNGVKDHLKSSKFTDVCTYVYFCICDPFLFVCFQ